ncbi:Pex N-terminal, partial [Trinorchestia longiramus]
TTPKEYHHLPPRISHLDAQHLDVEIHELLKSTLLASVQLSGVHWFTRFEPEIDALLKYSILRMTLLKKRASFGQQLLQMKYSDSVSERIIQSYVIAVVVLPWLQRRITDVLDIFKVSDENKENAAYYVDKLELIYRVAHIANLLKFLRDGHYSTVEERIFGLRPVPTAPPHMRSISYTYFSRDLLWNGFAELLGTLLPLISAQKFHNFIKSLLPSHKEREVRSTDNSVMRIDTVCVLCAKTPILPHCFGCTHVACYYCIAIKCREEQHVDCPLCDNILEDVSDIVPA